MDGISLLIEEHSNIQRMLKVIKIACLGLAKGAEVNLYDFDEMIDFIVNYENRHHQYKEEKFLFKKILNEIEFTGDGLNKNGVFNEHELGRKYIEKLQVALSKVRNGDDYGKIEVISTFMLYIKLISKHVSKEENSIYFFANQKLPKEILDKFNDECYYFEKEAIIVGLQYKYIKVLEVLEKKYLKPLEKVVDNEYII
ncbi:hemerythrin domain-containing protein [Haloimpatiens sp. FM7315]|uniref:hemerythrin domain-containing protein n=1 Tax=Haloimpatiens sp. FM7315 TaxID=3298609 RepID=UPI0035A2E48A